MFFGASKTLDNYIVHSSPTGFMASDAFTHNFVAQNTYDMGYIDQPPDYSFESNQEYQEKKKGYKLFHPPILPFITASLGRFSGLNIYDTNILIVFVFIALIVLLNYFILVKFNETLALLSLPLNLLFLQGKFFISLSWGWWDFILGEFFLFAFMLLILSARYKYRYLLSAILIVAAFMSHGIEAGYAAIFILLYLFYYLLVDRKQIKGLIIEQFKSLVLVLLIGGYSINVFLKGMGAMGYSQIRFMSNANFIKTFYGNHPANYFIYFTEFIGFRILIIIGCLILLYLLIKKKSNLLPYYIFVVFMSISPYVYFMAGERGYQWRFLWPIYLSFAFGSVIYFIYYLIKQKINSKFNLKLKVALFIIVMGIFLFLILPVSFNGSGLIDALDYNSYQWIHKNTDPYAKFWIMYTPLDNQISRLYLLKRDMFISTVESWQSMGSENSLILNLKDQEFKDFFCEKEDCSLFEKSNFIEKIHEIGANYFKNISICSFDYIYLNFKNQPEIHVKNVQYLNYLINKNITQVVYNNQQVVITKNIVKGEECERRFKN